MTDGEGFTFYFENEDNLEAFQAHKDSYPVGAGGYCGLAVSGQDPGEWHATVAHHV